MSNDSDIPSFVPPAADAPPVAYPGPGPSGSVPSVSTAPAAPTYQPGMAAYPQPSSGVNDAPPPGWYPTQTVYPYQVAATSGEKNKFGIMALIFGIISILEISEIGNGSLRVPYSWSTNPGGYVGFILGALAFPVLAVCMGVTGIRAVGRHQANNRGLSIAGVVMGGIFCALMLPAIPALLSLL